MIRARLKKALDGCFDQGVSEGLWTSGAAGKFTVELPKHEGMGDFATNMALVVAGVEKKNPRDLAKIIVEKLTRESDLIARVDIAGPGFINIFINPDVWCHLIPTILAAGEDFGKSSIGGNRRVMVEFVSANPTGPLSVGHGRQAILGDSIARLLEATGHDVFREYYLMMPAGRCACSVSQPGPGILSCLAKAAVFRRMGIRGNI